MEGYKKALELRKEGKYTEAVIRLKEAYNDNIYACWELYNAHGNGGWGIAADENWKEYRLGSFSHPFKLIVYGYTLESPFPEMSDYEYTISFLQNELDQGYITVISLLAKRLYGNAKFDESMQLLERGVNEGCIECGYTMLCSFRDVKEETVNLISHKQKHKNVSLLLLRYYWKIKDYKHAMTIYTESGDIKYFDIEDMMVDDPNCKFYVGREATAYVSARHHPRISDARIYYKDVSCKRRAAVLTWMLIGSKKLGVCKDINRYIGKLIFDSFPFSVWEGGVGKNKKNKNVGLR